MKSDRADARGHQRREEDGFCRAVQPGRVPPRCRQCKSPSSEGSEGTLTLLKFLLPSFLEAIYMCCGKNAIGVEHWARTRNEGGKATMGHNGCQCFCSFIENLLWVWRHGGESEMDPDLKTLWFRASESSTQIIKMQCDVWPVPWESHRGSTMRMFRREEYLNEAM